MSTCPHTQILPWLHVDPQRVKVRSIALAVAFSEQMCQVASTGLFPEGLDRECFQVYSLHLQAQASREP